MSSKAVHERFQDPVACSIGVPVHSPALSPRCSRHPLCARRGPAATRTPPIKPSNEQDRQITPNIVASLRYNISFVTISGRSGIRIHSATSMARRGVGGWGKFGKARDACSIYANTIFDLFYSRFRRRHSAVDLCLAVFRHGEIRGVCAYRIPPIGTLVKFWCQATKRYTSRIHSLSLSLPLSFFFYYYYYHFFGFFFILTFFSVILASLDPRDKTVRSR